MSDFKSCDEPITIELKRNDQLIVLSVSIIGCAILFFFLPRLAIWALSELPWVPWEGPLKLAVTAEQTLTSWGMGILGACAGLGLGLIILHGEPVVTISESELVVAKGDKRRSFARTQVSTATVVRGHLIIKNPRNVELLYLKIDESERLGNALREKGWGDRL